MMAGDGLGEVIAPLMRWIILLSLCSLLIGIKSQSTHLLFIDATLHISPSQPHCYPGDNFSLSCEGSNLPSVTWAAIELMNEKGEFKLFSQCLRKSGQWIGSSSLELEKYFSMDCSNMAAKDSLIVAVRGTCNVSISTLQAMCIIKTDGDDMRSNATDLPQQFTGRCVQLDLVVMV